MVNIKNYRQLGDKPKPKSLDYGVLAVDKAGNLYAGDEHDVPQEIFAGERVLSDDVKTLYGLGEEAVPSEVFCSIRPARVGDIAHSLKSTLGKEYALTNGSPFRKSIYPELYDVIGATKDLISAGSFQPINPSIPRGMYAYVDGVHFVFQDNKVAYTLSIEEPSWIDVPLYGMSSVSNIRKINGLVCIMGTIAVSAARYIAVVYTSDLLAWEISNTNIGASGYDIAYAMEHYCIVTRTGGSPYYATYYYAPSLASAWSSAAVGQNVGVVSVLGGADYLFIIGSVVSGDTSASRVYRVDAIGSAASEINSPITRPLATFVFDGILYAIGSDNTGKIANSIYYINLAETKTGFSQFPAPSFLTSGNVKGVNGYLVLNGENHVVFANGVIAKFVGLTVTYVATVYGNDLNYPKKSNNVYYDGTTLVLPSGAISNVPSLLPVISADTHNVFIRLE